MDMTPGSLYLRPDDTVLLPERFHENTATQIVLHADSRLLFLFPYRWTSFKVRYQFRNWSTLLDPHHCNYVRNTTSALTYVKDRRVYRQDYTCCNYLATHESGSLFCTAGPNYLRVLKYSSDGKGDTVMCVEGEGDFFYGTFLSTTEIVCVRKTGEVLTVAFGDGALLQFKTLFAVPLHAILGIDVHGDRLLVYTCTTCYFYSFAAATLAHSTAPDYQGQFMHCKNCCFLLTACLSPDGEHAYVATTASLYTLHISSGVYEEVPCAPIGGQRFTAIVRFNATSIALLHQGGVAVRDATTLALQCRFPTRHDEYVDMWSAGPDTVMLRKNCGRLYCLSGYWMWMNSSRGAWMAATCM
jgi:hypothetical protein